MRFDGTPWIQGWTFKNSMRWYRTVIHSARAHALGRFTHEVNASPSLSATTSADRIMKFTLVNDIINIVLPNGETPDARREKLPSKESLGNFDVLYDEELAAFESNDKDLSKTKTNQARGNRDKQKATWK
eukprot:gene3783-4306_t